MFRGLVFLHAMAAAFIASAAGSVAFDGTDYRLAHVSVSDLEVTNHYSPLPEVVNRGEPRFLVREFRGATSIDDVITDHLAEIEPTLVDAPLTMKRDGDAHDVVLILFRKTSDRNIVDYELERFAHAGNGVVSYRYSQRLPADADVTSVLTRQPQRIEQLFKMNVTVENTM